MRGSNTGFEVEDVRNRRGDITNVRWEVSVPREAAVVLRQGLCKEDGTEECDQRRKFS